MGRPTFKIDQHRLRALREEKNLTQAALAFLVAQHLGTPETETLSRHYQRIEENGQTSIRYANALAALLGVSMAVLQGIDDPDPSAYLDHIEKLIGDQLSTGTNHALQDMLAKQASRDETSALRYLAEDIAEAIEGALLVRNPVKIAELLRLTRLSEAELLAPANVRGFWFISVRSRTINCTEVVDAVSSVNYRIGEIMREFLSHHPHDSSVRMWRDRPWVRLEIYRPRTRDRMHVDFTRFQPHAGGLKWIDSSWRDDFFLEPGITEHAFANADVVTGFSGHTVPGDLHRLRLIVTEHDGHYDKVLRRMVIRGNIDNLPETVEDNFAAECLSRVLFVNWLTAGLRMALMPYLARRPAPDWHVTSDAVGVNITLENPRFPGPVLADLRYRIHLVEETMPSEFVHVPVREKDNVDLQTKIKEWLAEGYDRIDTADSVPEFEPI